MLDEHAHTPAPEAAWWTVADVTTYARVTERHVRQLIAEHRLPAYRFGDKLIRLRRDDVEALFRPLAAA